jgi:hypothetical protein
VASLCIPKVGREQQGEGAGTAGVIAQLPMRPPMVPAGAPDRCATHRTPYG